MKQKTKINAPFFEIGPKNYLYGKDICDLAKAADEAAAKYAVDVIFTAPFINIVEIAENTSHLHVFAPHMDAKPVGRGLANILPESIKDAGAQGVMLNHSEKPLEIQELIDAINRAEKVGLMTLVCASSMIETKTIAMMSPDLIVSEPAELIGTGQAADLRYVRQVVETITTVNPDIGVMVAGGVATGKDAYNIIYAGADATGSSSGIVLADNPEQRIHEMLAAVEQAWNDRNYGRAANK